MLILWGLRDSAIMFGGTERPPYPLTDIGAIPPIYIHYKYIRPAIMFWRNHFWRHRQKSKTVLAGCNLMTGRGLTGIAP